MKTSALYAFCLAALLAGPGTAHATASPADAATCDGEDDCRIKWQRAEQWVRDHSKWPIQKVTETVIETERQRFRNYASLYYRITKERTPDGQTLIRFDSGCLPSVHCNPDPAAARAAFISHVMARKPDGQ